MVMGGPISPLDDDLSVAVAMVLKWEVKVVLLK
jgi:hypothetical protein